MPVQPLGQEEAAALRAAPLSYPGTEPKVTGHHPATDTPKRPGVWNAGTSMPLPRTCWTGGCMRGPAFGSVPPMRRHTPGSVVVMRPGVGPLALGIPCRVVEVIDAPRRRGFVYGTLPGHPESGEERFVLDHDADGNIRFTVTAFSKPASFLARLGGPITRTQDFMTRRYLAALDRSE
jgi:hypothetical protein